MRDVTRRALIAGGLSSVVLGALTACGWIDRRTGAVVGADTADGRPAPTPASATPSATPTAPAPTPTAPPIAAVQHVPVTLQQVPSRTLGALPKGTPGIAWTVDDGVDADVVEAYAAFIAGSGVRVTFFLNGLRPSWTEHADALRPLIAKGLVQLGNHTYSHPDLRKLSDAEIVTELQRNHDFIEQTYGVDARPYWRPPYGYHDARIDAAAASIGYTTPVLWYGTLGDSSDLTSAQVLEQAQQWFQAGRIVIGHANHPGVVADFPALQQLLVERGLSTYTLNEVFHR